MMLHNLTIGHLDPAAIVSERRIAVLRPLEIDVVHRLLKELGGIDKDGSPTLERGKVEFRDGYLVCPWRIGGWHNRTAEEFALRLQQETGCVLADREHSRIIEPEQLQGLTGAASGGSGSPGEVNHSPRAGTPRCPLGGWKRTTRLRTESSVAGSSCPASPGSLEGGKSVAVQFLGRRKMNCYENPGTGLRQEGDKPPGPHERHGAGMVHGGRTPGEGEKGHHWEGKRDVTE